MPPATISTSLATEEDAPALASVMTAAFAASDAAYPLIWGAVGDGVHDMVAVKGLFTPVQKEGRLTFKAVDAQSGKIVGLSTWNMPKAKMDLNDETAKKEPKGGLPDIPGVNMDLWNEKVDGPKKSYYRDVDPAKDILLSFFFVHPDYQRQGIGSSLLEWGKKKADELHADMWLTSTSQAMSTYERNGWKVVDTYDVDLVKYGGEGIYSRSWMHRAPKTDV